MQAKILALAAITLSASATAQAPFPGATPPTSIGTNLPPGYEASGAAWHSRLDLLYVIDDDGGLSSMNRDGSNVNTWAVPGDLEAVCVADPNSNFIYIGREQPDAVLEFDLTTNSVSRVFDLTPFIMSAISNEGLEAMTFVPDPGHPEGGLFYAGEQATGDIYVFDLPIQTSATSTAVTFLGSFSPAPAIVDISGLDYERSAGVLWACYDSSDVLRKMTLTSATSATVSANYVFPGADQEGIAIDESNHHLFVSDDGGFVFRFDSFPTPDPDPCYAGTLGLSTLTIDGSDGGFFHRVEIATHQPFGIEIANPPSFGAGAPYLLLASLAPQPGAVGTALGFGNSCFPMLPMGPTEFVLSDTFGLGSGLLPGLPTPYTIAIPTGLVTTPLELTLQAVTFDTAAPLTLGISNAIELAVVFVDPPQLSLMTPLSAAVGSPVTISGSGFIPGLSLTVGGTAVTPLSVSPTAVSFAYPAGTSCDTTVVLANPDGQSVNAVLNPTPTVTNTILASGSSAGGAIFIVQGTGFATGMTVTIGGAPANVLSTTSLAVTMNTPPGTPGVAPVVLTTPGGCTTSTTYTYL